MADLKKEFENLYKLGTTGILDAVKSLGEIAKKQGLAMTQVVDAVRKAYDNKINPELEKTQRLQKGPEQQKPEPSKKLRNK